MIIKPGYPEIIPSVYIGNFVYEISPVLNYVYHMVVTNQRVVVNVFGKTSVNGWKIAPHEKLVLLIDDAGHNISRAPLNYFNADGL